MKARDCMCWIDCEMSQLTIKNNLLLEIAVLVTDRKTLTNLKSGVNFIVPHEHHQLEMMHPTIREIYTKNGLLEQVLAPPTDNTADLEKIDIALDEYMLEFQLDDKVITVGNSPVLDRALIEQHLPRFNAHLSHQMLDVTSVRKFLEPIADLSGTPKKVRTHRAYADVRECKEELRYYYSVLPGHRA